MLYSIENSTLKIKLPLTQPTSKVRVKQRTNILEAGIPIAARQRNFTPDLYLEWQIAYDTEDKSKSVQQILYTRHKINDGSHKQKSTFELTDLLWEAIACGLLPKEKINELRTFGSSIKSEEYLENNIQPRMERNGTYTKHKLEFIVCYKKSPILLYQYKNTLIELFVDSKQKAVGNQIMLFFDLPVTELEEWNNLQNRPAYKKEEVTWTINKKNSEILVYLAKCFMIGSQQHNQDLLSICKAIQKKLEEK